MFQEHDEEAPLDGDEDLVAKAEKEFFDIIEKEKAKQARKTAETEGEEKQDERKVSKENDIQ